MEPYEIGDRLLVFDINRHTLELDGIVKNVRCNTLNIIL
jgi:hypothetical protein